MDAKLQRWVQRQGWDRAVEHYETFWREQLRPAHDAVLDAAGFATGERVIDIACGTGMVTLPAACAVGPTGRVLATDISQRMVDDIARRSRELDIDNIDVERRDAEDLGPLGGEPPGEPTQCDSAFVSSAEPAEQAKHELDAASGRTHPLRPPSGFDVALCSLGLMYLPSPAVAVAEVARVLRPGGRVVAAVWGERRNCGWAEVFPIVDARVSSDVCPMFFALGAPGCLAGLVARAGFVDVEEHRISTELVYVDEDAAIGAAFLGGPVALAHARFDDTTKASAYDEYLASIEPFRDGAGFRVPGEFVIVAARLPQHQTTNTQHTNQEQP